MQPNGLGRTFLGELGTAGNKRKKVCSGRGMGGHIQPEFGSPPRTSSRAHEAHWGQNQHGGPLSYEAQGHPFLDTHCTPGLSSLQGHDGRLSLDMYRVLEIQAHWLHPAFSLYMTYITILEIKSFFLLLIFLHYLQKEVTANMHKTKSANECYNDRFLASPPVAPIMQLMNVLPQPPSANLLTASDDGFSDLLWMVLRHRH